MDDVLLIAYCLISVLVVYLICQYFHEYADLSEGYLDDAEGTIFLVAHVFMMGILWPLTLIWFCYIIFYNSKEDSYEERF